MPINPIWPQACLPTPIAGGARPGRQAGSPWRPVRDPCEQGTLGEVDGMEPWVGRERCLRQVARAGPGIRQGYILYNLVAARLATLVANLL